MSFTDYPSGMQLPDWSKLTINQKAWQWCHDVPKRRHYQIFWSCFVSILNFSHWFKFHVNIISGFGVLTIFFHKRSTRNAEIKNATVWFSEFFLISKDWSELEISNWVQMSLIKCYYMLRNPRVTAFNVSELLRKNHQREGRGKITSPPPRLGLRQWTVNVSPVGSKYLLLQIWL